MKKYIVHPGPVISKHDGDRHHIGFMELCRLYGVHQHECINADRVYSFTGREFAGLKHLHPRYDGNYKLEEEDGS